MTPQQQLERWVAGEWIHNGDRRDPESECTPDFGCCDERLRASGVERLAFMFESAPGRNKMLLMFLGRLVNTNYDDDEVHVTGGREA